MDNDPEALEPQNPPAEPPPHGDDVVTVPKKDFEDIKHRADVSSQNFERLKKLEKEHEALRAQLEPNDVLPEPDERYGQLESKLSTIEGQLQKREVLEAYPVLKDVWDDFDTFRADPENAGMSMKTAAKAFIAEKELNIPKRKGVERPTGGPRAPIASGMTVEEVSNLRKNNYKKYVDLLQKGLIKISD